MSKCTWAKCTGEAKHAQHSKDGSVWANLCGKHAMELDDATIDGSPAKIMGAWVKAKGGAKAAADSMFGSTSAKGVGT
jgi:hypothetical protein